MATMLREKQRKYTTAKKDNINILDKNPHKTTN